MRKYLHVLSIGVQNTLVYRANFLFRAAFGLIPLAGTLFVWRAIYAGKGPDALVGDYTLRQMISYYLLVTLVDAFTAVAEDDWQIAADIKDGNVSQFLLKPVDYLRYRLCLYVSGRAIYTTFALIPVVLFIVGHREYFVPPPDAGTAVLALGSTVLAGLLQFFIAYSVAMLAFWVLDVSTFIFTQFAFEYVASGHLFPLDILPAWLLQLVQLTPYPYLLYFPVGVALGRIQGPDLWRGLLLQGAWVVAGYVVARFLWRRGLRKYTAVGG
jgi:ABC-2 type transport system permease protein